MAREIIIDTDPGRDDAVAILLALMVPEALSVLGVTCVAGNVSLAATWRNARRVCALAARADIPVLAGCDRPLSRAPSSAEHVHGADGLAGLDLPAPAAPAGSRGAVDFLIDTLRARPAGMVTLVAIGPLTNIATAFARAPDVAGRVAGIVVMGGAHLVAGNVTPVAEFNIHADPEAADAVLRAGAPVTLVPLDVTHEALVTPERRAAFAALGTPVGDAVAALTRADGPDRRHEGQGVPLHDPCTIAWLLDPDLFAAHDVNVMVETGSDLCLGQTVVDRWAVTGRPANARLLHDVDAERLFALMTDRLARS